VTSPSYVGVLTGGKRVYVRPLPGDRSGMPIAFAVYADTGREGKMRLVGRFHDPMPARRREMYCANGMEHGKSACCWTDVPAPLSPLEAARWYAHWWTHVGNAPAEVVELKPTHGEVPRDRNSRAAARVAEIEPPTRREDMMETGNDTSNEGSDEGAVAGAEAVTPEDRAWLEARRAEFSAAGQLVDEHRCTDALNGDLAELAALRAGEPSPHAQSAGRSL